MSRFTASAKALSGALSSVSSVIEKRNTIPILANVVLELAGNTLRLRGTDLEIELQTALEVDGAGDGTTTIDADRLGKIVKSLPGDALVSVEWDEKGASIRSGRSRFTAPVLPVSDYPDMNQGDPTHRFTLPASALARIIARLQHAISDDESRYYLRGIYLHPVSEDGTPALRGVATNGHMMAVAEAAMPEGAETMPGIIVPDKTLKTLARLIGTAKDALTIEVDTSRIRVTHGETRLISKLIDGTYPQYERVIPRRNSRIGTLALDATRAAVQRAAMILDRDAAASSGGNFTFADGTLSIYTRDAEGATVEEEIEAEFDGAPLLMGFNTTYLRETLGALSGDTCAIALEDHASSALFTSPAEPDVQMVVMPMRPIVR